VEVYEYVISDSLHYAYVFVWWVLHVHKKRIHIIDDVIKRCHRRIHKFGMEVPTSWDGCVRLNMENGNTLNRMQCRRR
jgi:hypothetical protein